MNWGDGSPLDYSAVPAGASPSDSGSSPNAVTIVYSGSGGVWDIEGTHTYALAGNYNITVTAYDGLYYPPPAVTTPPNFTIINSTAHVGVSAVTGSNAATASGPEGAAATLANANFTDSNTSAPASDFSVTSADLGRR